LKAPTLDPNDHVHAIKCELQILNSSFVLAFELIEVPLEVSLCSADLLRKQIGPVLQVATDVTHLMIPRLRHTLENDQAAQPFRSNASETKIAKRCDFAATFISARAIGEKGAVAAWHHL
jgi:hypothetical protein